MASRRKSPLSNDTKVDHFRLSSLPLVVDI